MFQTTSPQSQSFSRSYGPNLPTSLIYITLTARGYKPWRPDADIGTIGCENKALSIGFSRVVSNAPDTL